MNTIKLKCENCKRIHEVDRDNDIPEEYKSIRCNWCPECDDEIDDYYEEWYSINEVEITDPNQTKLEFK